MFFLLFHKVPEQEKSIGETNDSADKVSQNPNSERKRLITVDMDTKEDRKECCFHILGNHTKTYNKWYPDDESQGWKKNIGKGKCSVCARMVQFDHSFGTYKDVSKPSKFAVDTGISLCVV